MLLNRRNVVAGLFGALALASGVGTFVRKAALPKKTDDFLRRLPLEVYDHWLGTAYLVVETPFPTPETLRQRLASKFPGNVFPPTLDNDTLITIMNNDLRNGHILTVQGWVMPETAVYLSAYAVLTQHVH